MKKMIVWIDNNLEAFIGSVFLVLMVAFTTIQVAGRYVLSTPFPWTEEMTRYMFIWMVYIAVGYAVKTDKHIRITFVRTLLPKKIRPVLDIFSDLVFLFLAVVCTIEANKMMGIIKSGGQTSVSLWFIPMWAVYIVMPIGFLFLCIRLVQDIIKRYKELTGKDTGGGEGPKIFEEGE